MRKAIIILLIFLALLTTSIFSTIIFSNRYCELVNIANSIESSAEKNQIEETNAKTKNLKDIWEKEKKIIQIFQKRENLDKMDILLDELQTHVIYFNVMKIKKAIKKITSNCQKLKQDLTPSFYSILWLFFPSSFKLFISSMNSSAVENS